MRTKNLLLLLAVFAASALYVNAQKLLISEEFSSPEWQAELLRLNPGSVDSTDATLINPNAPNPLPYAARTPGTGPTGNYVYTKMNQTDLYFDKYKLAGDIEIINGAVHPMSDTCALDGGNHNVMITEGDSTGVYKPLGFRLFKGTGFIEFPEISSAGLLTAHLICGNITNASTLYIEKWENEAWTLITTKNVKRRNNIDGKVDQIQTEDINSRVPIKLRLAHSDGTKPYFVVFEFSVAEHFSAGLKHSIDSATVIKNDNAGNIGTDPGQYPQAAYDNFVTAIDSATTIFDNTATTQTEVEEADSVLKAAIATFEASKIITGIGFNPVNTITLQQYGRKLVSSQATRISIYNIDGTLLHQQDNVKVMDVPASIGQGIYLVKSKSGVQKMYFGK
ncbi:MAG TPA: hypothetical protein PLO29_00795 [Paludibacter sp.]|nr:MAG: hypothetical protein BWY08_00353 [Bacteroidetes bacterium ADurb.Bin174]HQB27462.1 hypothetical protein [Paludibacter sp.]